jgi:hypothetical protein
MNVQTIDGDTWEIGGLDPSMWNLFRHALMADVAVQAVDRVTFHQYNGPLESSMVAHRLGQLPITGKEPLQFELKVEAPEDAPVTWVTAADITDAADFSLGAYGSINEIATSLCATTYPNAVIYNTTVFLFTKVFSQSNE